MLQKSLMADKFLEKLLTKLRNEILFILMDSNQNNLKEYFDFIVSLDEQCFLNVEDDFSLYIAISKYACNSLPKDIITNIIFQKYRIKKNKFPKKLYYTT